MAKTPSWKEITGPGQYLHGGWADGRGEVIMAGQGRLFRSHDSGANWETLKPLKKPFFTAVCRAADGALYLGDNKGKLQTSRDDGKTWLSVKLPKADRVRKFFCTEDHVYALSPRQLFHWEIGAEDWFVETPTPPSNEPWHQDIFADERGHLYLVGQFAQGVSGYVLTSADGRTWESLKVPSGLDAFICGGAAGKYIYVGGWNGAFMRSADHGKSWETIKLGRKGFHSTTLWAGGKTVLIADSKSILRSEDCGEHFKIDFETDEVLEGFEEFVGSATGHVFLVGTGHCFRAEVADAKKLTPAPIAKPRKAAPPKPERARTEWDDRLEKLLEVWRATRSVAVADLIDQVAKRVPALHAGELHRFGGDTLQVAWLAAIAHAGPSDVPELCATLSKGHLPEIEQRFTALARLPDDPRLATCSAQWVDAYLFGSTSSKPCWTLAFRLLERCADARTELVVKAARARGVPVKGQTMKTWLEGAIDRCLLQLPKSIAAAQKPLSAAQQAFVAQVEAALLG
jgi:photosystem II stability/assembly factor-like uncharacterized protein